MADVEALKIVGELTIGKLHLGQGDVLVVKVDRVIDSGLAGRIHSHIKPQLPDGVRLLVIDPAIELSVLTKSELDKMAG